MTPKEALKLILEYVNLDEYDYETKGIRNAETLLKQALKPPTVEEVCKALGACLEKDVSYGVKQFYYTIENTKCIMFVTETYGDGLWSINEYLPPHLITLIGRFYERLEVKE